MWYGEITKSGRHFYSKVKLPAFGRIPEHKYFTAKTRKELFKKMGSPCT